MIQNKRPFPYKGWVVALIILLLLGYYLSGLFLIDDMNWMDGNRIAYEFIFILKQPFQNYFHQKYTSICLLTMGVVWLICFERALRNHKHYAKGIEHGSDKWGVIEDINKRLGDRDECNNKVLSSKLRFSYNDIETNLNNNMVVIGGSGTGKTAFFLKPNVLAMHGSNVYTDPKGSLLEDYGNYLLWKGNLVRQINLLPGEMHKSDRYNPFEYIHSLTEVDQLITNLMKNTTPPDSKTSDPFWDKAERMYLKGIFTYVWMECPKKDVDIETGEEVFLDRTMRTVIKLLDEEGISDDEDEESPLAMRMNRLAESHRLGINHPAYKFYAKVMNGAADTKRSVVISTNARFAPFDNEELLRVFDGNDIDITGMGIGKDGDGKTKTSLFCIIPDDDDTYNFVIGMFYTQMFQELYRVSRLYPKSRLPIDVGCWFDEFANVKMPDGFAKILATCRSRGIYCVMILQAIDQLKTLYKDKWEGLIGNCDTLIYLGGNEQGTHKYISESLGKFTIDKKTQGESYGKSRSSSQNEDILGRELMTVTEVRRLSNKKCICMIRGEDPVLDKKINIFKEKRSVFSKRNKEAVSLGTYENIKYIEADLRLVNNNNSISYYEKAKKEGNPFEIYDLDLYSFLAFDFEGKEDNLEELRKLSEQNKIKIERDLAEEKEEITEDEWINNKKKSIEEIMEIYDYDENQLLQIITGLQNELSESDVKDYMNPEYPAGQMELLRTLKEKRRKAI